MLGIGIMSQIAWQTMIHIAVVTNVAPNTGISLPFFSSGGTSLLILLCEMGIMLSISRAGNAQNAARSKRSHEELARRMNRSAAPTKPCTATENSRMPAESIVLFGFRYKAIPHNSRLTA